jgi:hypothetical protein
MERVLQADFSEDVDSKSKSSSLSGLLNSKAEARIVSWVKNQFLMCKQARQNNERQWYLNMCFYYGKQNVAFRQQLNNLTTVTGTSGQLYIPPAPYWRSRPVINRIRPIIRGELSKLTSQKPTAYILPASSDDKDMFAAQAGEQIWQSLYDKKKIPRKIRKALWWNQVCGNSFIKCYWNPQEVDADSDQMGDICFEAITPFHLFVPDLREEELEKQPFLIHAQLKTPDWVKLNYPDTKINVKGDSRNEILDDNWLNIIGGTNPRDTPTVLCLELWVKPGRLSMFPSGGVFTVIGDTLVQDYKGMPFIHKDYPFAKLDNIPTGKFYTDSTIVDLISLQREYNRTSGQIIEAKNKTSKPQLLAEKGSVDPSKMTSEPGQVIEYQPGMNPPQPLPIQPLPTYVLDELERIKADMSDLSGQHEVSKGQAPPGVTAATAINYLQEQDDSMLSFTYASLEETVEKIAYQSLTYVQQFWETPRIVKVTGDDGFFDSLTFKGSDLRGNTDIKVEAGSALPISKSAKQAFIMDLMKMGFVDPPTGLEVMEMGGIAKIYEAVQTDVRQAQRENLRMSQIDDEAFAQFEAAGQQANIVAVNSFDNHEIHIATHNKFRKGQSYEALSEGAKTAFELHVQMHVLAATSGAMGVNAIEMIKEGANLPPEEGGSQEPQQNQFLPPVLPGENQNQQATSETSGESSE